MKDEGIMVLRDVALHTYYFMEKKYEQGIQAITNNLLMTAIRGKKYLQGNYEKEGTKYFPNIAGIKISRDTKKNIFEIFNFLMIKWSYLPSKREEEEIIDLFNNHLNPPVLIYNTANQSHSQ
jgi:hypothetical protein